MLTIATGKEVALLLFHTPTKYGSDRFRQIFIDHWERWWDCRQEEIPADQRADVQKTIETVRSHFIPLDRFQLRDGCHFACQPDAPPAPCVIGRRRRFR